YIPEKKEPFQKTKRSTSCKYMSGLWHYIRFASSPEPAATSHFQDLPHAPPAMATVRVPRCGRSFLRAQTMLLTASSLHLPESTPTTTPENLQRHRQLWFWA
ncbi:unnamed protein product, partial [Laminaria digitata]